MPGSNHCFLTCIQVSQEAGKVIWYSHLLKNAPQFDVIQTVKGFSIVTEAEVDVFLEFPCFSYDPTNVGKLISGSSAFSKSSLNIWKFSVYLLLKPSLENFECVNWLQLCGSLNVLWHCLSFGLEWKLTFFRPVAAAVFQICWCIECSTFTASSFRIWNRSAGIPSPPQLIYHFRKIFQKVMYVKGSESSWNSCVKYILQKQHYGYLLIVTET